MKRSPLTRRTPLRWRPKKQLAAEREAHRQVDIRSSGLCEAHIPAVCTRWADHHHHRRLRSQGGETTAGNLLAVCSSCHSYAHRHPAWAESCSLIITRRAS